MQGDRTDYYLRYRSKKQKEFFCSAGTRKCRRCQEHKYHLSYDSHKATICRTCHLNKAVARTDTEKSCTRCSQLKSFEDFHNNSTSDDGLQKVCKQCQRVQDVMRKFLVDEVEAIRLIESSGCEICGRHGNECIDHDHESGRIRGVLCDSCNKGLGMFGDDIDRMKQAIKYLEEK